MSAVIRMHKPIVFSVQNLGAIQYLYEFVCADKLSTDNVKFILSLLMLVMSQANNTTSAASTHSNTAGDDMHPHRWFVIHQ